MRELHRLELAACLVDALRSSIAPFPNRLALGCVLACHRYIELNPVRAAMVTTPLEYPWSSYRANAEGHHDPLLSVHEDYRLLGADDASRRAAYRALFEGCITEEQTASIHSHLVAQRAYGTDRFREAIERQLGRSMQVVPPGRSVIRRTWPRENDSDPFDAAPEAIPGK